MITQKQTASIEKLYSKKCVADLLNISTCGVDRLRKSGELRSVMIGGLVRFKEAEILRFLEYASCR